MQSPIRACVSYAQRLFGDTVLGPCSLMLPLDINEDHTDSIDGG
jgi:hypothetical protein